MTFDIFIALMVAIAIDIYLVVEIMSLPIQKEGKCMENIDFENWDKIFAMRDELRSSSKDMANIDSKGFFVENGIKYCSKCGSENEINNCGDCKNTINSK